ncbi:hypothetical protein [Serratia fonticola]|uniref:hypothetical protein n=1 Tax=Serratia fonticola TaxID=47917 RepID=UPI003AAAE91F|nr:hypothetical protein [Serratia fonticola]HBE9089366.1 hypothetical protein [Serratia fonticola]
MTRSTLPTEHITALIKCVKAFPFGTAHVVSMAEKMLLLDALAELLAVREAQSVPIGCIKTICGNKTLWWWRDAPEGAEVFTAPPAPTVPVTAVEHQRVILMLLGVCGAAFELADDCCQQEVDGELCHVVPGDSFKKLSDALDEIENTLPDEYEDLPNTVLKWAAVPRHALRAMLQPVSQGHTLNSPVIPDGWKLVPKEPTTKQWAAGYKAMDGGIDKVTLAYRAMVEVAPSPGGADDSHATAT